LRLRRAVDRGGRREHELQNAMCDGGVQERASLRRVVCIIEQGLFDRIGDRRRCRKMHDRGDLVLFDQAADQVGIADVTRYEFDVIGQQRPLAGGQIVDDDAAPAALAQRQHNVTADVAGAAGHQNGH